MTQVDTNSAAPAAFWRRTPPAVFPTIFGLMGLGMSWRAATLFAPSIGGWVGGAILALACAIYLAALLSFAAKIAKRPGALLEDMASVPGRAGVAAMSLCLLLFSAAVLPISLQIATAALFAGLALHAMIAALALFVMTRSPQGLAVSPAWHLNFVGFIVAPLSAVALGYTGLAQSILAITVGVAGVIYAISLLRKRWASLPPPQRPLLMIHLAPLSLFASCAALLQMGTLALGFGLMALGLAVFLALRVPYLITAGFSPLWGAFTFPLAALTSALFALSPAWPVFGWLALAMLCLISCLIPVIALRVLRMWVSGVLAAKTGAAVA